MTVYESCEWIENGMDFDVGSRGSNILMCCYISCPGGGNIFLKRDYKGEDIDWDEFWKLKNSYRDIQKSGRTIDNCRECVLLIRKDWSEENHIKSVIFDHFTACNCDCYYCYTHADKKKYNSLKTYNVLKIVKDMHKRGILQTGGQIGFGGGEPTILKEFDSLLKFLLDNGYDNINVPTSGIRYSPILERGIKEGKARVLCSIDSGCRETYRKIKNVDAFDKVVNNLKKYARHKKNYDGVNCKYIICPGYNDNIEEAEKFLNLCKSTGIEAITIAVESIWMQEHRYDKDNKAMLNIIDFLYKNGKQMFKMCIAENFALQFLKAANSDLI